MKRLSIFVILGSVVLLLHLTAKPTNAAKYIIEICEFAPVGYVSPNGRQVYVQNKVREAVLGSGEQLVFRITAVQPQTGAMAVGGPIGNNNLSLVHAIPGSPPFQPGPAVATSQAFHLFQGKVIRIWTWSSTVTLVPK